MTDREVIVPLKEPVSIEKALLGGRQVRVSTSTEGSSAAFLVNIQLTGWNNTKEYNEGYARGFNNAAEWMQKAIASHAASIGLAARATAEQSETAAIPEGCTPEDAQMLRLANHGLAQEIDRYRIALSDLCLQIHTFAEKYGEADFETGRAERLLQSADAKTVSFLTDHERIELYELRDAVEHAARDAMMNKSSIPVGWKLVEKRTHFELVHEGCVIASLAGPNSEPNAAIIARALKSQQDAAIESQRSGDGS
jgi:hypothetical protein